MPRELRHIRQEGTGGCAHEGACPASAGCVPPDRPQEPGRGGAAVAAEPGQGRCAVRRVLGHVRCEYLVPILLLLAFGLVLLCPDGRVTLHILPSVHMGSQPKDGVVPAVCPDPARPAAGQAPLPGSVAPATGDPAGQGGDALPEDVREPVQLLGTTGTPEDAALRADLQERYGTAVRELEAGHAEAALGDLARLAATPNLPAGLRLPVLLAAMRGQAMRLESVGTAAAADLEAASLAVLEENPSPVLAREAMACLATACGTDGRFAEGLDHLLHGLLVHPGLDGADALFLALGKAALEKGDAGAAQDIFAAMVAQLPDSALAPDAWAGLVRSRERLEAWPRALEAMKHLSGATAYFLKDPDILLAGGRCLARAAGLAGRGGASGTVGRRRARIGKVAGIAGVERLYRTFLGLELQGEEAERTLLGFGDLLAAIGSRSLARDAWRRLENGGVTFAAYEAKVRLAEGGVWDGSSPRKAMEKILARAKAGGRLDALATLYGDAIAAWPQSDLAAACRVKLAFLLAQKGENGEARDLALEFLAANRGHELAELAGDLVRETFVTEAGAAQEGEEFRDLAEEWESEPDIARAVGVPDMVTACALGRGYLLWGDSARAVAVLRPLLAGSMSPEGLYALAVCYQKALNTRDFEEIVSLGRAVASWALPDVTQARLAYACAVAEQSLEHEAEAAGFWEQVLAHPQSLPLHRGYASFYLGLRAEADGSCAEAQDLLSRAVELLAQTDGNARGVQGNLLARARTLLAELAASPFCRLPGTGGERKGSSCRLPAQAMGQDYAGSLFEDNPAFAAGWQTRR